MSPPESYELLENNKARVNTFKSLGQIIDIKDSKWRKTILFVC